jgi:peptidyl-prolyl cis-trans isomerase D
MRSAARYIWVGLAIAFIGGFVFYESSGLFGRGVVTATTPVASVNGRDVPYQTWVTLAQNMAQQQEQQLGRSLTLDERKRVDDEAFDQLVTDILLQQEYAKRGIRVTDQEIQQAAMTSPPPELMQNPELQTEGRFDPAKYERFVRSPNARAQGLLVYLENYYRTEIPRQKLFAQVVSDVYLSDHRLWSVYKDTQDSAAATFVALRPEMIPDAEVAVSDQEIREYYDKNKADLERPGHAIVSVVEIRRQVTAADSAATRQRAAALRAEIAGGATFEDVARRESTDSASAAQGGSLGRYVRGSGFVAAFEQAAFALRPGELSQPVLSPFGYHLIRVDSRKGDTLDLRHILLRITQSDSSAAVTDRRADSLANLAAQATDPKKFDEAARKLNLLVSRGSAFEGEPLQLGGRMIPSVSAWAFGGARQGETSDLLDTPDSYFLARLDSLQRGGVPSLEQSKNDIRAYLSNQKKLDKLVPRAAQLAEAAKRTSLEAAAAAQNLTASQVAPFTRVTFVPGIGQFNEAIGAAFAVPVGAISKPVKTDNGVYVLRVDRRVPADSAAWVAQKDRQRAQMVNGMRQQRVQQYLRDLRASADVEDNRREINEAARNQTG